MSAPRVAFVTHGCRVNQADTLALEDALRVRGVTLVTAEEDADVYVLNSCTVTGDANTQAQRVVRKLGRARPHARVIVTGCAAELAPQVFAAMPQVALVAGNARKTHLADEIVAACTGHARTGSALPIEPSGRPRSARRWTHDLRPSAHVTHLPTFRARPFVKVQDGCDYSCAFCVIPLARGASRSIEADRVLAELRGYVALGAQEAVLTGIHLGHWGRDLSPRATLAHLLERVATETGLARVRLGSVEPNEITDALLEVMRAHPSVCPHLHLPLQSGDDGVLRRMRRLYTTADYAGAVRRTRAVQPEVAIGADVIVGHPGEDDAAFERTVSLVRALDLAYLHVFPYSPRPGTASALQPDRPPSERVAARVDRLCREADANRLRWARRFEGREVDVLVDLPSQRRPGTLRGVSRHYVPVEFDADPSLGGHLARVRIDRAGLPRTRATLLERLSTPVIEPETT